MVIGNPPYRERARGRGGWVESGTANVWRRCALDAASRVGCRRACEAPAQSVRLLLALGRLESLWLGIVTPRPETAGDAATGRRVLHRRGGFPERTLASKKCGRSAARNRRNMGDRLLTRRTPAAGRLARFSGSAKATGSSSSRFGLRAATPTRRRACVSGHYPWERATTSSTRFPPSRSTASDQPIAERFSRPFPARSDRRVGHLPSP